MDPITHTFVGASLSATGLRRATPLATATLILAANAPDIDIVAQAAGPYAALAWRRGITHGLPALVVLPFFVMGVVWAWDRWVRRRRRPTAPAVRPAPLLGLAGIGVWTHPTLDWVNTYGMRWLSPLDGRWFYGDSIFILDPWLWLMLGGGLFVLHSRGTAARLAWAALGGAMTLLVLGAPVVPTAAKAAWILGVAGWILLRARWPAPSPPDGSPEPHRESLARWTVGAASLYLVVMTLQTALAERITRAEATMLGVGPIEDMMVGPVPANPFRAEVILRTQEGYHRGAFSWLRSPRLRLDPGFLADHPEDAIVRAAAGHPEARHYLVWARFPWYRVREESHGWTVEIRDVRYLGRSEAGSLTGLDIGVDRDLRPRTKGR